MPSGISPSDHECCLQTGANTSRRDAVRGWPRLGGKYREREARLSGTRYDALTHASMERP